MKKSFIIFFIIVILIAFSSCKDTPYSDNSKNIEESYITDDGNVSDDSDINSDEIFGEPTDDKEASGEVVQDTDTEQSADEETSENEPSVDNNDDVDFEEILQKEQEGSPVIDEGEANEPLNSDSKNEAQDIKQEETFEKNEEVQKIEGYTEPVSVGADIEKEAEMLGTAPAPRLELLKPNASGVLQISNEYAVIDYSNTGDGYVMMKYNKPCENRLKAQLKCNDATYSYNVTPGQWEVFPLSLGSGEYTLTVYRNVVDSKYASVLSTTFDAVLNDEFTAFLYPNQYVDYSVAPKTVDKAYELTKYEDDTIMKLSAVYDFVVSTITYDKEKAANVKSGYLPVLDSVLESGKGICFDYAALMTGMLRSQGIPCKLVVGYAGSSYHAWISVWTESSGWIDGAIYFDGVSWHRMDPTFASSSGKSDSIMKYIGDGKNYTEKYLY